MHWYDLVNWSKYSTCPICHAERGFPCMNRRPSKRFQDIYKAKPHEGRVSESMDPVIKPVRIPTQRTTVVVDKELKKLIRDNWFEDVSELLIG